MAASSCLPMPWLSTKELLLTMKMHLHHAATLLLSISSGLVRAQVPASANISSIEWFACDQNASLPVTCGSLNVPLDYTNPSSNATLQLHLLKFNAVEQPAKGSVLFNPGGPGVPTLDLLALAAPELMAATSGYYDLIGFDTRGVGQTLPFSCFDPTTRAELIEMTPPTTNDSDTSLGLTWSLATLIADSCYNTNSEIGELMSTAFIARDMMQIVDALGEDGLLRYYGLSWGTVLGATVAAMFPNRMDKVVLDGVVNVFELLNGRNAESALQTDAAVYQYFNSCLSAPEYCAIQRPNATATELYNEVIDMLETIKYNPLVLGDNITTSIVQYGDVKTSIYGAVAGGMDDAQLLSAYLAAIMSQNTTLYQESTALLNAPTPSLYPNYGPEAGYAIQCGDTALRYTNLSAALPLVESSYAISYYGGPPIISRLAICAQWKTHAKETFTGPFDVQTRNPMLLVSSPYDPVTPLASARNTSALFNGSVLLQQNGIGHTSVAQPSSCTVRATAAYFLNGTLPVPGTVCEPDFGLFANATALEVYLGAGS